MTTKLTAKQDRFCSEYMVDLNATQAAIRAGYSKKTANRIGPENLSKPVIKDRVQTLMKGLQEATGITARRVIEEYAKIGFSNIKEYLDDGNEIKDISQLPDEVAAAVDSIQCDIRHDGGDSEGYTEKVKIKLHSKLNALDSLGRHLDIFNKDNQSAKQEITITIPEKFKDI
jgi:phage terminase small subunit